MPSAVPRSEVMEANTFLYCQSDQCLEGAGATKYLSIAAGKVPLAAWGISVMAVGTKGLQGWTLSFPSKQQLSRGHRLEGKPR